NRSGLSTGSLRISIFSHDAHTVVSWESCHPSAPARQRSSEILIPSIKACQSCHNGNPSKAGKAENGCFLCHAYHNWKQRTRFHSRYTIEELTGIAPLQTGETAAASAK